MTMSYPEKYCLEANCILGRYLVKDFGGWTAELDGAGFWEWNPDPTHPSQNDVMAAMLACQQHYEATVRSALR